MSPRVTPTVQEAVGGEAPAQAIGSSCLCALVRSREPYPFAYFGSSVDCRIHLIDKR